MIVGSAELALRLDGKMRGQWRGMHHFHNLFDALKCRAAPEIVNKLQHLPRFHPATTITSFALSFLSSNYSPGSVSYLIWLHAGEAFQIRPEPTTGKMRVSIGSMPFTPITANDIPSGIHHYVLLWSTTDGRIKVYLNGVKVMDQLVATTARSLNGFSVCGSITGSHTYNCRIDEIAFWFNNPKMPHENEVLGLAKYYNKAT